MRFAFEPHRARAERAGKFADAAGSIDPGLPPFAQKRVVETDAAAAVAVGLNVVFVDRATIPAGLDPAPRNGHTIAAHLPLADPEIEQAVLRRGAGRSDVDAFSHGGARAAPVERSRCKAGQNQRSPSHRTKPP